MSPTPRQESTPGPWETGSNAAEQWVCEPGGGDIIADLMGNPNGKADAQLIVCAVNSHAPMRAALELAAPTLDSLLHGLPEFIDPDTINAALLAVRAALKESTP